MVVKFGEIFEAIVLRFLIAIIHSIFCTDLLSNFFIFDNILVIFIVREFKKTVILLMSSCEYNDGIESSFSSLLFKSRNVEFH